MSLKGVFGKNERGYRLTVKNKHFLSLLILLLSVASIRRKANTPFKSKLDGFCLFRRSSRFGGPGREGGGGGEEGGEGTRPNVGISIRALWEQMEELIDLLDQVIEVAMSGGRQAAISHYNIFPFHSTY